MDLRRLVEGHCCQYQHDLTAEVIRQRATNGWTHRRKLSGAVEATQEHACIHTTVPWPRKTVMPKPPELEEPAACFSQLLVSRDQRLRLRSVPRAARRIQWLFFLPAQRAFYAARGPLRF